MITKGRSINMSNDVKKYTFNLYESDVRALQEIVDNREAENVTQALRAAVATEKYIREAVRHGGRVFIENQAGAMTELVFKKVGE